MCAASAQEEAFEQLDLRLDSHQANDQASEEKDDGTELQQPILQDADQAGLCSAHIQVVHWRWRFYDSSPSVFAQGQVCSLSLASLERLSVAVVLCFCLTRRQDTRSCCAGRCVRPLLLQLRQPMLRSREPKPRQHHCTHTNM